MSSNNTQISLGILRSVSDRISAESLRQTYINLSPDWQRPFSMWHRKDATRLIETILQGQVMNPAWTIYNSDNNSREILDGQHRIKIALEFINDKFKIDAKGSDFFKDDHNKIFSELKNEDQMKILEYNIQFNNLGSKYYEDEDARKKMFYILNKTSVTLNDYEFNNVSYNELNKVITKYLEEYNKYLQKKNERGIIETEIWSLITLSDKNFELPNSWESVPKLVIAYQQQQIGKNAKEIKEYIENKLPEFEKKINFLLKIIDFFDSQNMHMSTRGKGRADSKYLPKKCIIARCAFKFKNIEEFNREKYKLLPEFNDKVLNKDTNLQTLFNCSAKNSKYQKELIKLIDNIIDESWDPNDPKNRRCFSNKDKQQKLKIQDNKCNICKRSLFEKECQADHIIEWTNGGETIIENCQILCSTCHKDKKRIIINSKRLILNVKEFVKDYIEEGTGDDIICFEKIYPLFQKWYEQTIDNKVPDQKDFVQIVREILGKESKRDTLPASFVVGYKLRKMVRN